MSVEEAKQVTTSFKKERFIPPPRKISDVLALLNQELPDSSVITLRLATVKAIPPEKANNYELSQFYLQKGLAAQDLGMEPVEEFRTAMSYAGKGADWEIYKELSAAEFRFGNARRAIGLLEEARRKFPQKNVDQILVKQYAKTGQMGLAEKAFQNAINKVNRMQGAGKRNIPPDKAAWAKRIVEASTAEFLELNGEHQKAEAYRRSSLQISTDLGRIRPVISDNLDLAQNLLKQNRAVESEVFSRKALTLSLRNFGKKYDLTTNSLQTIAAALSEQGRYEEAEQLERVAIEIRLEAGERDGTYQLIKYRRNLVRTLLAQEKWAEALQVASQTKKQAQGTLFHDKLFVWSPGYPFALLANEKYEEALHHLQLSLKVTAELTDRGNRLKMLGLLAVAEAKLGNIQSAIDHFEQARPWLVKIRENGDQGRVNQLIHRMISEHYIELLSSIAGTSLEKENNLNALMESFIIADISRSQTVQADLIKSGSRAAIRDPELKELARKEQDSQKQLEGLQAILAEMLSSPTNQQIATAINETKMKIELLEKAQLSLQEEIIRRFPEYAELSQPRPASVDDVKANLKVGETLIAFYLAERKSYVWSIPKQGDNVFLSIPLGINTVKSSVYKLREALDFSARTFGDIPKFDLNTAYSLYRELLKPLEHTWQSGGHLIFLKHGALNQLPLAVLVTESFTLPAESAALFSNYRSVPWLIKQVAITSSPSAMVFISQRSIPADSSFKTTFGGFGDPVFNGNQSKEETEIVNVASMKPISVEGRLLKKRGLRLTRKSQLDDKSLNSTNLEMLQRLPDSSEEVLSVAQALGADRERDVFIRYDATESNIKTLDLSDKKVLLFATHALIQGDLDGLTQPAIALSSPGVVGGEEDGLLTMEEIMGLRLNADWVVLSACNSAAGSGEGAEAISGLGRAFFYAGTRALLVSHWSVETNSAKTLTTGLFKFQADNPDSTRAKALQKSQLNLIDQEGLKDEATGKIIANYAHPVFWAPFTLVGDG